MVEAAGNKEFGSVFLQQGTEKENVAVSVVQNGWAKVGGAAGGVCAASSEEHALFTAGAGHANAVADGPNHPGTLSFCSGWQLQLGPGTRTA